MKYLFSLHVIHIEKIKHMKSYYKLIHFLTEIFNQCLNELNKNSVLSFIKWAPKKGCDFAYLYKVDKTKTIKPFHIFPSLQNFSVTLKAK